MLFGVGVSCHILYSLVSYLYASCSGSITLVREEREVICLTSGLLVSMWFLFGEVASSSSCLGWAALFYFGTPWAFHIILSGEPPVKHMQLCCLVTVYVPFTENCFAPVWLMIYISFLSFRPQKSVTFLVHWVKVTEMNTSSP